MIWRLGYRLYAVAHNFIAGASGIIKSAVIEYNTLRRTKFIMNCAGTVPSSETM
jgi:hypothetical protein